MRKIIAYNDIDRKDWSRLVLSSATATWFQTPEAYDFFASQPNLFNSFAFGIENEDKLRGICTGYITVERSGVKQIFTRRAIIIGGPMLAEDATLDEVETLMNAVRQQLHSQAIYIETRNFNDYSKWRMAFETAGFAYMPHLSFHVDCTDKEAMDARMSENRKRQIKKAIKSGVEIKSERISESEIKDWYNILQTLYATRVKTPLFPLSFFIEFYRQGIGKYLLVKYEEKVIGGIMCPILDGRVIYEWFVCGNDAEYRNQNPSVMATYAAMEYAYTHGMARFDFMGAGKPNEPYGVRDFKARFGGSEVEYGRFSCVTKPLLYKIGTIGVKILKKVK